MTKICKCHLGQGHITGSMGPLHVMVTWCNIHYAGEQVVHWDNHTKENLSG